MVISAGIFAVLLRYFLSYIENLIINNVFFPFNWHYHFVSSLPSRFG